MKRAGHRVSQTEPCKRRAYRKSTMIGGQVSTGDRSRRVRCRVLDMSAAGARIAMEQARELPSRIALFLDREGVNVDCEVVWQQADQVGVRFCSPILPARKTGLF